MLNKVKVSTIPLQNGECAVEIVITIEQSKKVKQESTIYAETLEALAETWMDKDQSNHDNDEDEGFLYMFMKDGMPEEIADMMIGEARC